VAISRVNFVDLYEQVVLCAFFRLCNNISALQVRSFVQCSEEYVRTVDIRTCATDCAVKVNAVL